MSTTTVFNIPIYVVLASPDTDGKPRLLILIASLYMLGGSRLKAHVDWQQVPSDISFLTPNVSEVRATAPAFVDVVYPPEILNNPLYLVVGDPPGVMFPHRILFTVHVTEFNPGDPLSLRVFASIVFMPPPSRVNAGALSFSREHFHMFGGDQTGTERISSARTPASGPAPAVTIDEEESSGDASDLPRDAVQN
ncbi:hypothetical protein VTO73DRAFT_3520 [Trametes versicolor]